MAMKFFAAMARYACTALILAALGFVALGQQSAPSPPIPSEPSEQPGRSGQNGGVQMLSPADGVDFAPYLKGLVDSVKRTWYASMPKEARDGQKGLVVVQFRIQKDGTLLAGEPRTMRTSGHDALDKAAANSIRSSAPFGHLPATYDRDSIELRFIFLYNRKLDTPQK